jgi:hypothetical protein
MMGEIAKLPSSDYPATGLDSRRLNDWDTDMLETASPYESPSPALTAPPLPPAGVPAQIRVLAILHLVFAGLSVVTLLFSLVSRKFSASMISMQEKAGGIQAKQAEISQVILKESWPILWLGYASGFILGLMLLRAGLALFKQKKSGLSWSNSYAWTSILFKVVHLILFLTLLYPKLEAQFSTFNAGKEEMRVVGTMLRASTLASGILGPLVMCLYPIIVLILLNRESVRKSLV